MVSKLGAVMTVKADSEMKEEKRHHLKKISGMNMSLKSKHSEN
jgi:hypothetical protein